MKELTLDATTENIETVTNFVNEQLQSLNCPTRTRIQIDIAIDELFGNIAYYAYGSEVGSVTVRVEVLREPLAVSITFVDHGLPYDPLSSAEPDITQSSQERQIGGLGIYMVKKTMDEMSYRYQDGQNILTIKKQI